MTSNMMKCKAKSNMKLSKNFSKKSILMLMLCLAGASISSAANLSLELRSDLTSVSYNEAAMAASANSKNNYQFNLHSLKVDGKGSLNEALSYRLKLVLNKTAVTAKKRETGNDWTELAYLNNKVNDLLSVTAGKFNSDVGGYEGMTSSSDLYLTSAAYSQITNLKYHTGLKAILQLGDDHNVSIQVANQEYDSLSGTGLDQNRSVVGSVYKGNFMDKSLKPVLSYFSSPQSTGTVASTGATTDSSKYAYTNLGLRYEGIVALDLDYGMIAKKETSAATTGQDWGNTVLKVSYKMDSFLPSLKWYGSTKTDKVSGIADVKTEYDGIELAVEYKPVAEQNMRYHLAYMVTSTKPATGDKQSATTMIAGFKMTPDFMK